MTFKCVLFLRLFQSLSFCLLSFKGPRKRGNVVAGLFPQMFLGFADEKQCLLAAYKLAAQRRLFAFILCTVSTLYFFIASLICLQANLHSLCSYIHCSQKPQSNSLHCSQFQGFNFIIFPVSLIHCFSFSAYALDLIERTRS